MAITAPTPADDLPVHPSRGDDPDNFRPEADAFVAALPSFGTQLNSLASNVYDNAVEAEAEATAAAASAVDATNNGAAQVTLAAAQVTLATTEADRAESEADRAQGYADDIAAAVNFKGEWNTLTGALNMPATVFHSSYYWVLLNNLADVTASEPGVSADWELVAGTWQIGDVKYSNNTSQYTSPTWLPCDGSAYNEVTYAGLAAMLGKRFATIADPSTVDSSLRSVCFSDDGAYMAVTYSKYGRVYTVSGSTFTALAQLTCETTYIAYDCSLSSDGTYFAAACQSDPRLRIFKNTADVYTELVSPLNVALTGNGRRCAFSHNDTYIAAGTTNDFKIYKRSGDTFTSLTLPSLGSGEVYDIAWSPDDNYLAIGRQTGDMFVMSRTGDTFTVLTDPAITPLNPPRKLAWSGDSSTLFWSGGGASYEYLASYNVSGTTLTNNPAPDIPPPTSSTLRAIMYDNERDRLIIADAVNPPNFVHYDFDGTNLTYVSTFLTDVIAGTVEDAAITSDDQTIVFVGDSTMGMEIQQKQYVLPVVNADFDRQVKAYIKTGE